MFRVQVQFRHFLLIAATILSACAIPANSPEDIQPDEALVIGQYFEEDFRKRGTWANPEPQTTYGEVVATFSRYDPLNWPRTIFRALGEKGDFFASAVKPGKYRLDGYKLTRIISGYYWPDLEKGAPVIDVRPGEAVYIGDAVARREDNDDSFRLFSFNEYKLEIRDTEASAKAFFDSKFSGSGLKFIKRLMKRVPNSSLE
jgi:hypothetical protein